ncbi:gag_pre-integrs domain-containing protein [Cephalotus follicularis]|uniref:Gag_pre-integrs domain-containing protein n=1 Tax=Cephalotus follicularis TaxID=3775 RepID=A0A1Q3BPJ8_CEPFO|nr:gag_pre-integrs domain-containing protein [Cephalotus follicularis]
MFDGVIRTLEAWHVPGLKKNLISLGVLDSHGCKFTGENGIIKVLRGALVIMKGKKIDGLYQLQGNAVLGTATVASSSRDKDADTTRFWHIRLGHMSERGLQILSKKGLLAGVKSGKLDFCEHCVYGKQCRVKFSTAIHKSKGLDYIHSDLWGPSSQLSLGGSRYLMTLMDDYSRKV